MRGVKWWSAQPLKGPTAKIYFPINTAAYAMEVGRSVCNSRCKIMPVQFAQLPKLKQILVAKLLESRPVDKVPTELLIPIFMEASL